jgi:hypothetical protein
MSSAPPEVNPLPYRDTKPVGAADFYFAINATFRFVQAKLELEGLRKYWRELGRSYFAPVTERWRGGFGAVAQYWRAFFAAEPGAEVDVAEAADAVTLTVRVCPAIAHLRAHGREIVPRFCEHCYFVSEAMAEPAGLTVRVEGGNGSCVQRFLRRSGEMAEQDLGGIQEAL